MPRNKNKNNKSKSVAAKVDSLTSAVNRMALATPTAPKPRRRRRRAAGSRNSTTTSAGDIVISRRELFLTIKTAANSTAAHGNEYICPGKFSFLKSLDACFERFKFLKCHFYYKPAVGTTYGGLISFGVDWDRSPPSTVDRKVVSGYTPNRSLALWNDSERNPMVLPPSRLQSRNWYVTGSAAGLDNGPGSLVWAIDATSAASAITVGEIWVDYTVHFSGTKQA